MPTCNWGMSHQNWADATISPVEYSFKTDADGRFRADQVPVGRATVWVRKAGFVGPGLGVPITTPKDGLELTMIQAASVRVTVEFAGKDRPAGYIVQLTPEGGDAVGTYGGSGNIDAKNQMTFNDVPPGKYFVVGHPNPSTGDQKTKPLAVDLKGGHTAEITLKAK